MQGRKQTPKDSWDKVRDAVEYVGYCGLEHCMLESIGAIGVVEGLYHKAKLTLKRLYGLRTFPTLELALYQVVPEFSGFRSQR
jgi:hypothetical protein